MHNAEPHRFSNFLPNIYECWQRYAGEAQICFGVIDITLVTIKTSTKMKVKVYIVNSILFSIYYFLGVYMDSIPACVLATRNSDLMCCITANRSYIRPFHHTFCHLPRIISTVLYLEIEFQMTPWISQTLWPL